MPLSPKGEVAFYFFTWFSFYELGGRYTLIFSIEVTSCGDTRDRYKVIISREVTSFRDAGDRYTLIFSIKVTSFGDVLFGRFSLCLNQWAGGIPCL